ncbi:MAG: MarR family transcriptional regulator [Candidatus Eremiobacterota bacterium]
MEKSKELLAEEIRKTILAGNDKLHKLLLKTIVRSASNLKNISLSQLNVLMFLESRERARMKEIGEELGIKPSSATNLVDRLIKSDLIERSSVPDDRRVVEVSLTEKGKEVIEEVRKVDNQHWEKMLVKIDEREYEEILRVVKKLDNILCEIIQSS